MEVTIVPCWSAHSVILCIQVMAIFAPSAQVYTLTYKIVTVNIYALTEEGLSKLSITIDCKETFFFLLPCN